MPSAQAAVKDTEGQASDAKDGALTIGDAMKTSVVALSDALAQSGDSFKDVPSAVDSVYDQIDTDKANAAKSLRDQMTDVKNQRDRYEELVGQLEMLRPNIDEQFQPALDAVVKQLDTSITSLDKLYDALDSAAKQT